MVNCAKDFSGSFTVQLVTPLHQKFGLKANLRGKGSSSSMMGERCISANLFSPPSFLTSATLGLTSRVENSKLVDASLDVVCILRNLLVPQKRLICPEQNREGDGMASFWEIQMRLLFPSRSGLHTTPSVLQIGSSQSQTCTVEKRTTGIEKDDARDGVWGGLIRNVLYKEMLLTRSHARPAGQRMWAVVPQHSSKGNRTESVSPSTTVHCHSTRMFPIKILQPRCSILLSHHQPDFYDSGCALSPCFNSLFRL